MPLSRLMPTLSTSLPARATMHVFAAFAPLAVTPLPWPPRPLAATSFVLRRFHARCFIFDAARAFAATIFMPPLPAAAALRPAAALAEQRAA